MQRTDRFLAAAALAVIGIASIKLALGPIHLAHLLMGVALVACADLMRVRLTSGRPSSLAIAPGIGLAVLTLDPALSIVAFAIGTAITGIVRRVSHQASQPAVGGHLLAVAAGAVMYALLERLDPFTFESSAGASRLSPAALLAAIAALAAVDTAIRTVREHEGIETILRALLPFQLAAGSAAALFALSEPVLGLVAYPLFLGPLLATHHAFDQLASVRRTFSQMIKALSGVPEIAGYSHPGHAARTAALSRAVGRQLGLRDRELGEVETAARLHDLGRMRARTPDEVDALPAAELASGGATVVRTAGAMPRVAALIERSHEPFGGDDSIPMGARIIRVASTFDDLTATGDGALSDEAAIAAMRKGAERFDARVLDALSVVVTAV
jgi:hypothetical protein